MLACLEKSPADRPQSARELSLSLAQMESGGWTESDARDWWTTHGPK